MDDGLHSTGESKTARDAKKGLLFTWKPEYEQLPDKLIYINNAGKKIKLVTITK